MGKAKLLKTEYKVHAPVKLRIAVLADFHNGDPVPALQMLEEDTPDIIVFPGDLIRGSIPKRGATAISDSPRAFELMRGCAKLAPAFVSLGNHEWAVDEEDLRFFRETGIVLLDDEWVRIEAPAGLPVLIGGLSSGRVARYRAYREKATARQPDLEERYPYNKREVYASDSSPKTDWLADFEREQGYKILLSHHPEYWNLGETKLAERGFDLVISGHAHGGQIRFGLQGTDGRQNRVGRQGIIAPGQGLMPRLTSGVHTAEFRSSEAGEAGSQRRLIISRGMSNPQWPIPRWGNPCEIVYIQLSNDSND